MILRAMTLAGGLTGAAGLSQFPEFSQQYVQRLGGAVSELEKVVADFDTSAAATGFTRDEALSQMVGSEFVERRRDDMQRTFTRFDKLTTDLETLQAAGPFTRAYNVTTADSEIVQEAWGDFKPAVPLTMEGGIFALTGLVTGAGIIGVILAILRGALGMIWRREPA